MKPPKPNQLLHEVLGNTTVESLRQILWLHCWWYYEDGEPPGEPGQRVRSCALSAWLLGSWHLDSTAKQPLTGSKSHRPPLPPP